MAAADGIMLGMRGLFDSLGKAGMARDEAQMMAGLRSAQAYNANMAGNKHGADAASEQYTLGRRQAVPEVRPEGMSDIDYLTSKVFQNAGPGKMHDYSNARGDIQKQSAISDIQAGGASLPTAQAYAATSGHAPFAKDEAGYSRNTLDGSVIEANPVIAKLFRDWKASQTGAQNANATQSYAAAGASGASAGLSNERRKEIQMGKVQNALDADGNPILFRAGTNGKTTVMEDLAPFSKSGGADAAATKLRGQIARDVQKDPSIYPEEQEAEIERRLALAVKGGKAKGAAPAAGAPNMDSNKSALLVQAKDAIAKGAPRAKVMERLKSMGVDTTGL